VNVGHDVLLRFLLTGFTVTVKTELMFRNLIARGLRDSLGPVRDTAKKELHRLSASFTGDMVMMFPGFTELIPHNRFIDGLKNNSKGFEKIEAPVDGGQADLSPLVTERPVEVLGTKGIPGRGEFLIDQESGMAQFQFILTNQIFENVFIHNRLNCE